MKFSAVTVQQFESPDHGIDRAAQSERRHPTVAHRSEIRKWRAGCSSDTRAPAGISELRNEPDGIRCSGHGRAFCVAAHQLMTGFDGFSLPPLFSGCVPHRAFAGSPRAFCSGVTLVTMLVAFLRVPAPYPHSWCKAQLFALRQEAEIAGTRISWWRLPGKPTGCRVPSPGGTTRMRPRLCTTCRTRTAIFVRC